jgi:hypothetical protein
MLVCSAGDLQARIGRNADPVDALERVIALCRTSALTVVVGVEGADACDIVVPEARIRIPVVTVVHQSTRIRRVPEPEEVADFVGSDHLEGRLRGAARLVAEIVQNLVEDDVHLADVTVRPYLRHGDGEGALGVPEVSRPAAGEEAHRRVAVTIVGGRARCRPFDLRARP